MAAESLYILTVSCRNKPGIVSAISSYLFASHCDITEAQQFDDSFTRCFFMRVVFRHVHSGHFLATLREGFQAIAASFHMKWSMVSSDVPKRVMILVSRFDHCLADLLYRWRMGELNMDITAIVSNYPRSLHAHHDFGDIPFHYLPAQPEVKSENEAQLWALIQQTETELVVLARYMQVLSADLAEKLEGRCINIHHSFLPGFKGAKPYHQAHERGVKLIGATAHYVTSALDEGPIIEQDVERISHRDLPQDLIRKGRDIERRVLARAVDYHVNDRILMNNQKTIVFSA